MTADKLTLERRGHLLLMGFNRPEKRNAFDVDTYRALAAAYGELDRDPELRCGVLFGHGAHFTAGLDLPQWAPVLAQGKLVDLPRAASSRSDSRVAPLSQAHRGRRAGRELHGGDGVMLAAESASRRTMPFRATGSVARLLPLRRRHGAPDAGNRLGQRQRYMLTGEEFGAEDALRMGFVQAGRAGQQLTQRSKSRKNRRRCATRRSGSARLVPPGS